MTSLRATTASDGILRRTEAMTCRAVGGPLIALLLVAAAIRLFAWSRTAVMFNDGPVFLAIAQAIGEGRWSEVLSHPYHPLYSLCIHAVSLFGAAPTEAAVAVSIFGALVGILAMHSLLRRTLGLEAAWLGAWILALHPWAVDFSADVMSDGLYLGFFLASLAALAAWLEGPNCKAAAAFSMFTVVAFLVRPEALGLLIVGALLLGVRLATERSDRRAVLRSVIVASLVTVLGLAPYVGFLSIQAGELTFTQKKSVGALVRGESRPSAIPIAATRAETMDPVIWLPQSSGVPGEGRPPRVVSGAFEAMTRVLRTSAAALRYEVLLFVMMGLFWSQKGRASEWRRWILSLPAALYSGLLILLVWGAGYVSRRHALAGVIPLIGFAAVAWQQLGLALITKWERRARRPAFSETTRARLVCAALVVILAAVWGPRDLRERRTDRAALRGAAEWLEASAGPVGPVAAEKLRIAYYAGTSFVPLRASAGQTLATTLRRAGARFVVVDSRQVDEHAGLVESIGQSLHEVHRVARADHEAIVFEVE